MDYLYTAHVNERIRSGNLPDCELEKDLNIPAVKLDFHAQSEEVLVALKDVFPYICVPLRLCINILPELEALHKPLNFVSDVNLLINTECDPRGINIDSSVAKKAIQLCPCITAIDKALCMVIELYGKGVTLVEEGSKEEAIGIFFTWIFLLKVVQNNERVFGKTLKLSAADDEALILDLLSSPWNESHNDLLIDLTAEEKKAFEELFLAREDLQVCFHQERNIASSVALETEGDWNLFLKILNDLSNREFLTVERICADISPQEKLDSISQHISLFHEIKSGFYTINGISYELSSIIPAVKKRMEQAPEHCNVNDSLDQSFRLCPEAVDLLSNPITFNFLLITYHQFRINPNKANALYFSNLALNCLNRNFLIYDEVCYDRVEAIVEAFGKIFLILAKNCHSTIKELSFDSVQPDSVATGLSSLSAFAFADYNNNYLRSKIASTEQDMEEKGIQAYYEQIMGTRYTREQIKAAIVESNQAVNRSATVTVAHQIVVSLNIAYLLCDALRIMQTFNNKHMYFENISLIDRYKSDLEREIDQISYSVYTREANIKKYREEKGVDARSLSDREAIEEKLRSVSFVESVIGVLDEIERSINNLDLEGIIILKTKVRDEIRKCAICTLTDQFSERFISISEKICNRLVNFCKTTEIGFDDEKQNLLLNLGRESRLLPLSSLESLTTAELLYRRYASDTYAQKGFDYSSISALYYQAFEDTYNKLIWRDYAKMLNYLPIGDQSFTNILKKHKNKNLVSEDAAGYLPIESDKRKYYTNKNHTSVNPNCTYGAFGTLLVKYVVEKSEMFVFCNHFAKVAGFTDSDTMLKDTEFICKVHNLGDDIIKASRRRNDASHGGNPTTISQCKDDKVTVLDELKSVREDSIGLTQKLLYLLRNSESQFQN